RHERVVAAQRGDHRGADAEHGQDHRGHCPVQQPREGGEPAAFGWRAHFPFSLSAGVTAPSCFGSPAPLLNDRMYTAERALSSGSSEGAMPGGSTRGSNVMSVAGLVVSLSSSLMTRVPTSSCSRSCGQAIEASWVGSPGCPTITTRCHRNGCR